MCADGRARRDKFDNGKPFAARRNNKSSKQTAITVGTDIKTSKTKCLARAHLINIIIWTRSSAYKPGDRSVVTKPRNNEVTAPLESKRTTRLPLNRCNYRAWLTDEYAVVNTER